MRACLLTSALLLVLGAPARPAGPVPATPPTVTVRPVKDRYILGEPIGVVLTIRNPGAVPVEFRVSYPFSFAREFHMIRFHGGRAMPPLVTAPIVVVTGPLPGVGTRITAGGEWSATVFLQNYLHSPQCGEFRVDYRFQAHYRVAGPDTSGDDPLSRDYPSLSTEGSMTIRVGPPDPVALGRVLEGYVERITHPGPAPDSGKSAEEAVEALQAVDGPVVIPYVAAVLEAIGRGENRFTPGLDIDSLFEVLGRYAGDKDARLTVVKLLRSENAGVGARALDWLGNHSIPVDPGVLVDLFDRERERMEQPDSELLYLQRVELRPTPALRDRVARCLGGERLVIDAYALRILARWGVPEDMSVRIALARLAESSKKERSSDLPLVVDALAAWKYPLGIDTLRDLLSREEKEPIPEYASILDYIANVRLKEYRGLGPRIASLLTEDDDEVVIAAIKALDALDYPLTRHEVTELMKREPGVREATSRYLGHHPVY